MSDVVVVGAGLAGLTAAVDLHHAGISVTVIDARERVGGRLLTLSPDGLGEGAWFDLGATWHWSNQPGIAALATELGVASFAQFAEGRGLVEETPTTKPAPVDVPAADPAELRFVGGAQQLCQRLADRLAPDSIVLATSVTALAADETGVTATAIGPGGDSGPVRASFAVLAVPPRLAVERIAFTPSLPDEIVRVMKATTTWMARAVKCVAVYDTPFWREDGWSGFAFSHAGPLREVHDACTHDGSIAALWGFVAGHDDFRTIEPGDRARLVLAQLERLFGPRAGDPVQYFERDWSADPNTIDDEWYSVEGEPVDYGHPTLAQTLLCGRVVLAGTETADVGGGHMEGAVRSGHRAAESVARAVGVWGPNASTSSSTPDPTDGPGEESRVDDGVSGR